MNAKLFIKNLNCMKENKYDKLLLHFLVSGVNFLSILIVLKHIKNKNSNDRNSLLFENLNLIEFFLPN